MTTTNIEISKDEAVELIRANAWDRREGNASTCGHPGCEDHPLTTRVIHTVMRVGADWSEQDAIAAVCAAQSVWWGWSLLGHDLFIVTEEDRLVHFQVQAPDSIRDQWAAEMRAAREAVSS